MGVVPLKDQILGGLRSLDLVHLQTTSSIHDSGILIRHRVSGFAGIFPGALQEMLFLRTGQTRTIVDGGPGRPTRSDVGKSVTMLRILDSTRWIATRNIRVEARFAPSELLGKFGYSHSVVDGATSALDDVAEGHPEVPVETSVDDRVQEAISVPQPKEHGVQPTRYSACQFAQEGLDQSKDEKWQPTGNETAHDDAKSSRGFAF